MEKKLYFCKIFYVESPTPKTMKKCLLSLLVFSFYLLPFSASAQNAVDSQGRRQGLWVKTDKHGAKMYEGTFVDGLETGTFTYYYADGTVRIRNTYSVPGKVCSHEVYDSKGRLLAKGEYYQKNRNGRWEFYNEKGRLIKITHYRMGVRHGMQATFTAAGDTAEVCTWDDNHRHGRWWKRIGKSGYITTTYNHGALEGKMVEYDNDGLLARDGFYKNGDRHGHFHRYEGGQLVVDEIWKKGDMEDRLVRLLTPEPEMVSIYDILYMVPQGKKKVIIYLANGNKMTDFEGNEDLYRHIGDGRFSLVNQEARIMVATDHIIGITFDNEGRETLKLDPAADFSIFPDEDCKKMLHSLQLQKITSEQGYFDFER